MVNHKCDPLYGNVYLQSYSLLLLNTFILAVVKALAEERIIPFFLQLLNNNREEKQNLIEKPIAEMEEQNDHIAKIDPKIIFLYFQAIAAAIAVVRAFMIVDYHASSWDQYQIFFGFLLNSPAFTYGCSVWILRMDAIKSKDPDFLTENPQKTCEHHPNPFIALSGRIIITLAAFPLCTHGLVGCIMYCWLLLIFALTAGVIVMIVDALREYINITLSPKFIVAFEEAFNRLLLVFYFQTSYDFAYLLYREPSAFMTGSEYLHIVTLEYSYRTQSNCNFQHAFNSFENALVFLSWM